MEGDKLDEAFMLKIDQTAVDELIPTAFTEWRKEHYNRAYYIFDYAIRRNCVGSSPLSTAFYFRAFLNRNTFCDASIKDADKVIELNRSYVSEAWNLKGVVNEEYFGAYDEAFTCYSQAIQLGSPSSHVYYCNRASILERHFTNRLDEAEADYTKSISLNNDYVEAYNRRAVFYERRKQKYDLALLDYNQAIAKMRTPTAYIYFNRALLLEEHMSRPDDALRDLNKAIELEPKNSRFYNCRALLQERFFKKYDEALADYNIAIELNPRYREAYFNRADLVDKRFGNYQQSIEDYTAALTVEAVPKVFNNRGVVYRDHMQEYDKALADFDRAIQLDPKYCLPYAHKAFLYLKLDNLSDATHFAEKCLDLDKSNSRAHYVMGVICYRESRFEDAFKHFERFLELGHSNPTFLATATQEIQTYKSQFNDQSTETTSLFANIGAT